MTELTNLLPPERIQAFKREYFMRLATVVVLALSAVVIGSGALLVPSYLFLNHEIQTSETRLNELNTSLTTSNGKQASAQLASLTETARYLTRLSTTTPATAALRSVLAVPRNGIVLSGMTFVPATHGNDGKMTLTGIASTRETLRMYNDALATLPYVSNVDLPISSYAKESNIPFVITITGSLSP